MLDNQAFKTAANSIPLISIERLINNNKILRDYHFSSEGSIGDIRIKLESWVLKSDTYTGEKRTMFSMK